MRPHVLAFRATLTGGEPLYQPSSGVLPPELVHAAERWTQSRDTGRLTPGEEQRACATVAPLVEVQWVPTNLLRADGLLSRTNFVIPNLTISAVDFSDGVLPCLCAEVVFNLEFETPFPSPEVFELWQEANDELRWAIGFIYTFDVPNGDPPVNPNDRYEDLVVELLRPGDLSAAVQR